MDIEAVEANLRELSDEDKAHRVEQYLRKTNPAEWQHLLECATWELLLKARLEAQQAYERDQAEIDGTISVQLLGGRTIEIERRPRETVGDVKTKLLTHPMFRNKVGKMSLTADGVLLQETDSVAYIPRLLFAIWKTNWLMAACRSPKKAERDILFFFSDNRWIIWDFDKDQVAIGPMRLGAEGECPISFHRLPHPFIEGFDAIVQEPPEVVPAPSENQYLIFCGAQVLRWSDKDSAPLSTHREPLLAVPIGDVLPALPPDFQDSIDSAVRLPGHSTSLLLSKAGKWIAYDMASHTIEENDSSMPFCFNDVQKDLRRLESLPEPFRSGVDAAVCRPGRLDKELILFSRDQWMLVDYVPDARGDNSHGPHKVTEMWMANINAAMHG